MLLVVPKEKKPTTCASKSQRVKVFNSLSTAVSYKALLVCFNCDVLLRRHMETKNSPGQLQAGSGVRSYRDPRLQKRVLREDFFTKMAVISQTKAVLELCSGTEKA